MQITVFGDVGDVILCIFLVVDSEDDAVLGEIVIINLVEIEVKNEAGVGRQTVESSFH